MPHYRLRNFTDNKGPRDYPEFPLAKILKRKRGKKYVRNEQKKYVYKKRQALKLLQQQNKEALISEIDENHQTAIVNSGDGVVISLDTDYAQESTFIDREEEKLDQKSEVPESMHCFCNVRGYLPCREPINMELAEKVCVGTKIRMFWPPEKSWSNGVVSYVYGTGMFNVDFEDDTEKGPLTYCLSHFHFEILRN